MTDTEARQPRVIIRHHKWGILVLCPLGHLVTSYTFAKGADGFQTFAGSRFQADITDTQYGRETWLTREADACQGMGHCEVTS